MGLFSCPVEILQYISSYLSVKDVLALSQTCHHLRDSLNTNCVWKRYLPQQDISSLESHKQYVQCGFSLKPVLSPLCENRVHFMRKTHLLNNWRKGHCTVHVIQEDYGSYVDGKRKPVRPMINKGQFYDDRYILLLADFEFHQDIEFWNIEVEPVLHMSLRVELVNDAQIVGNYLVVFVPCKICVYKIMINEHTLSLVHSFITTEHSIVLNKVPNNHYCCPDWSHYLHDEFLISFRGNNLHVSNIIEGSVIGAFPLPHKVLVMKNRNVIELASASGNYVLFYILNCDDILTHKNVIFNTRKKEIFELNCNAVVLQCKIYKRNIIIFAMEGDLHLLPAYIAISCILYDLETATEMSKRRFEMIEEKYLDIKIVNGRFALPCFQCIKVIDVVTLNTVHEFHLESPYSIIYQFVIFDSIITAVMTSCIMKFWDIEKDKELPPLPYLQHEDNYILTNSICTKVVAYDRECGTISVLNFW